MLNMVGQAAEADDLLHENVGVVEQNGEEVGVDRG